MSTGTIVAVVAAIIVIAAVVIMLMAAARRRRLQQRFGPEYDRLVGERDSKLKAEAELSERERRVHRLDIRPLTPSARANYADRWAGIQERFVDEPADAVEASHVLVVAVMSERGYPAEQHDQVLADLSVEHAKTLDQYRAAEAISASAAAGTASTEDLRQGMIYYRVLFRDLLGEPANAGPAPATDVARDRAADDALGEPAAAGTEDVGPRAAGTEDVGPRAAGTEAVGPRAAGTEAVSPRAAGTEAVSPRAAGTEDVGPQAAETSSAVPADEPIDDGRPGIRAQRTPRI